MSSNIRVQKICLFCKQSFVAKTTVTKYCGDDCAKKAYKARKKKKKIQTSFEETLEQRAEAMKRIMFKDFLDVKEVCTAFGISRTTLWRLTKSGKLRQAEIGKRAVYLRDDLYKLFNISG